jgi:hypothetical protein
MIHGARTAHRLDRRGSKPCHWPAPAPATSTTVRYPQRAADAADPYAHVDNLARVVVVQ